MKAGKLKTMQVPEPHVSLPSAQGYCEQTQVKRNDHLLCRSQITHEEDRYDAWFLSTRFPQSGQGVTVSCAQVDM